jgi:AmmeMemoRadiSam system protein A
MPEAARGPVLLAIAREAIAHDPDDLEQWPWEEPWLRAWSATFVTLRLDGELQGCIGSIDPRRALGDDVANNARASARDSRFPPLEAARRDELQVEVSVLSARSPLAVASEDEAIQALRPGIDGVVLEYGLHRATFLPQVWEELPQPITFLQHLRRKAHLPPAFWDPALRLSRYTVEKFR